MTSRSGDAGRSTGVDLPPFQHLLDAHAGDLHRFLVGLVGPVDADDALQETLLAALRAYPRLRDGRHLRSWLFTIAYRKAVDAQRARTRRPDPVAEPPEVGVEDAAPPDGELWAAVDALPRKQRSAVLHRYRDDWDYRRIGEALGCSADAARRNAHEGVRRLRETWTS